MLDTYMLRWRTEPEVPKNDDHVLAVVRSTAGNGGEQIYYLVVEYTEKGWFDLENGTSLVWIMTCREEGREVTYKSEIVKWAYLSPLI